jgi:hypothetical protein
LGSPPFSFGVAVQTIIGGIKDTLDARIAEFAQTPLRQSVFVNAVPKGGTHLLRNILRMFAPVEQHYHHEFIQLPILRQHAHALTSDPPYLSVGHLLFSDEAAYAVRNARHIVLTRDPYDWVLARARFYLSDEFNQPNLAHLKTGATPIADIINMMIFGCYQKIPSLMDIYANNVVSWMGTAAVLVRYEDVVAAVDDLASPATEVFFMQLFADCGIDPSADWRQRIEIGADRRQSRTARENLKLPTSLTVPDELSAVHKKLVDFHAPGLRNVLGYA